ncbi:hypothetical protein HK101_010928 [Irineochytrium annulatum]|nr:hypothetical protein HK101_010928 [Irineochytrium annulatum]
MKTFGALVAVAVAAVVSSRIVVATPAAVPIVEHANVPLGNETSYLITSLPKESTDITSTLNGQYSGYIPTSANSDIFFWYFKSQNTTSNKLVIWLNGGPGCSSLVGSFVENGPVQVQDDGNLTANPYSWHKLANMLYVEQPAGVGFSFTTAPAPMVDELQVNCGFAVSPLKLTKFGGLFQIAADFYTFLNGFYAAFPETKSYELFITGESYAGFYIPYIANELVEKKKVLNDGSPVNLVGIAIGNGILGNNQYSSTDESLINDRDFLVDSGFYGNNATEMSHLNSVVDACLLLSPASRQDGPEGCFLFNIANASYVDRMKNPKACLDIYNIEHDCNDLTLKEANLKSYLNTPAVRQALHVTPELVQATNNDSAWAMCSDTVGQQVGLGDFKDKIPATDTVIPKLIDAGLAVYLINGDLDYILHYVGLERTIGNMTWAGSEGFPSDAPLRPWSVDGTQLGLRTYARGLTYFRVFKAGHMVPLDQPAAALSILTDLLTNAAGSAMGAVSTTTAAASAPVGTARATVSVTATTKSGAGRTVGVWGVVGAFVIAMMMV